MTVPVLLCAALLIALDAQGEQLQERRLPPGILAGASVTAQAKPGGSGGGGSTSYEVKGSTKGLFPGSAFPMAVKIENPYAFAISVRSIGVVIGNATSACLGTNIRVDPLAAPIVVPANGEVFTNLTIRMRNDPPDTCWLATFPLTFTSQAVKA